MLIPLLHIEIGSLPTVIEEVNCILLQIQLQILFCLIGITLTCKLLGTQIHLDPFGTTIIPIGVHSQKVRQKPKLVCLPKILNYLPSEPEQATALGVDPSLDRGVISSEETHTPSPRGPPKAKARPKPVSQPKEPDHPPPWVPSLRPAGHQSAPKVSESVASVPPPRVTGGAAEKRPKLEKAEQASDPKASGEASVPEPPKPKASDPKVAKPPKDNPLNRLGSPPNYPAPPVPPHRDFHQTLGPPPQRPPRAATPRGERAATAIPPPPSHPPPSWTRQSVGDHVRELAHPLPEKLKVVT